MSFHVDASEDTALQAALLRQPRHVLFPPAGHFSAGFGESGWRTAVQASNEHLIPRGLTLGFQTGRMGPDVPAERYLDTLLAALRLHADALAEDREVVAMVLQLGLAEALPPVLLGQLLDAVPQYLRTVARPQVEARLDAGSGLSPAQLRAVGCTRLNVIDRADAPGPAVLAQARDAGFTARYYQLRVPAAEDAGFIGRLQTVLADAPERVLLPAPCALPEHPSSERWLQAWRLLREAGYVGIGGDHYQRGDLPDPNGPGDGQRHCDLAGVPRRDRSDFIGIGLAACSQIGEVVCRTEDDLERWQARLRAGHVGVAAGLILSEEERLAAEVAQCIACDHALDAAAFEWRNDVPFDECFAETLPALAPLLARGWARWDGRVLRLAEEGRLLWRMMAACFRPAAAIA
ncbi:coproporphyrinogen III oxidase [Stenotrophomonas indicatrix]|uniref:coproporphyrinogen III oxidase n=1 Tax=Stenotrophomonas indicatrix TaxID=2045451 RepID=UPI000FD847BB|nr:coproporphyrinogen III oxidase [Stenotrophomonas indicatrix]